MVGGPEAYGNTRGAFWIGSSKSTADTQKTGQGDRSSDERGRGPQRYRHDVSSYSYKIFTKTRSLGRC